MTPLILKFEHRQTALCTGVQLRGYLGDDRFGKRQLQGLSGDENVLFLDEGAGAQVRSVCDEHVKLLCSF